MRALPAAVAATGAALLLGVLVSLILARRLKRITFGLELDEIADLLREVEELAIEQASLRRVATLVATGVARDEVFAAVAEEVGQLADADTVQVYRYEPDGWIVRVAIWGSMAGELKIGDKILTGGRNIATLVLQTGTSARIDGAASITGELASVAEKLGFCSVAGIPIVVDGRVWGLVAVTTTRAEPMAVDTEQRIADFTELAATAIANAQAHADLAASRLRVVSAPTKCGARSSRTSMTARSSGSSRCPLSCPASTTAAPLHRNYRAGWRTWRKDWRVCSMSSASSLVGTTRPSCPRPAWGPR